MKLNSEDIRSLMYEYNINTITAFKICRLLEEGLTQQQIEDELTPDDTVAFARFSFNY